MSLQSAHVFTTKSLQADPPALLAAFMGVMGGWSPLSVPDAGACNCRLDKMYCTVLPEPMAGDTKGLMKILISIINHPMFLNKIDPKPKLKVSMEVSVETGGVSKTI